jgi:GLPGLI family protein
MNSFIEKLFIQSGIMNSIIVTLSVVLLLLGNSVHAQAQAGVIEYDFTADLHRNIPPEREAMKAMIPQYRESRHQLLFNAQTSLYKEMADEAADLPQQGPGRGMRMAMQIPRSETYIDRERNEIIVQQDFNGTTYLISEPLELGPWRMDDEILEIAGYNCMMAWKNDTILNQEITAWFTMDLPPFLGPERYTTLPGTVLAVDINNGERVWVAREIILEEPDETLIQQPTRGQKLTRDEFNEMMREQLEKMNRQGRQNRF